MRITETQLRKIIAEEVQTLVEAIPLNAGQPPAGYNSGGGGGGRREPRRNFSARHDHDLGGGGFDPANSDKDTLKEVLKILLDVLDNEEISEAAHRKIRNATSHINMRGVFSK
jgi:hypothetical protein